MFDLSEDYKIKFCLDFFFGKINSKKFKQFKSQEENNGTPKNEAKRFIPAPKERNKHAICQIFFRSWRKNQVIS